MSELGKFEPSPLDLRTNKGPLLHTRYECTKFDVYKGYQVLKDPLSFDLLTSNLTIGGSSYWVLQAKEL